MAVGILALVVLSIYGSLTISTILIDQKKAELKNLVQTAVSIVTDLEARSKRGEISEEEAKKLASYELRILRYGGSEYFFIMDYQNVMLMHPFSKSLEGKDNSNLKRCKRRRVPQGDGNGGPSRRRLRAVSLSQARSD
ncbi:cache domain-containing protein [Microvirga vignae]|uniref:cache domain-containing protein n=1 Tax=Microvirga vignae TaxID=1225564 RepID=UPI000699DA11|nr:cache domain-containing protein [Microvirga vignae]